MAKINSSDIAIELADAMGLSKSSAKAYSDFVFGTIKSHIEKGDEVSISNFGRFKMKVTAPRTGRNIHTGESVNIPARHKISFEMSRALKKAYDDIGDDMDRDAVHSENAGDVEIDLGEAASDRPSKAGRRRNG